MLYYMLLILLAPILIYQGKQVRKTALKLPEASGKRAGKEGEGMPLSICILGDSAAAGVGVEQQSQALSGALLAELKGHFLVHWLLEAKSGNTTLDCIAAIQKYDKPVDIVVLSIGVNDVLQTQSIGLWLNQQQQLVELIRTHCQAPRILLTKVPPMGQFPLLPQPLRGFLGYKAGIFNRVLSDWVEVQPDCTMIDIGSELSQEHMAADGFHPGESIYARWGQVVAEQIISTKY